MQGARWVVMLETPLSALIKTPSARDGSFVDLVRKKGLLAVG